MTLSTVPEWNWPTVTTTGSQMSMLRVTNVSIASHHLAGGRDRILRAVRRRAVAAGAADHDLAWCRHAAMNEPRRVENTPLRSSPAMTWIVYAAIGRSPADVEQALGDHRFGAARAFLARLEHEDHVAGEVVAAPRRAAAPRRPASPCADRGRRRASHRAPRTRTPDRSPPARAARPCRRGAGRCGPGRPPRSTATTEDRSRPVVISSGSPASASRIALLRPRQLQADLRIAMQLPPERDDVVADRADLIGECGSCLNRHRNAFAPGGSPGRYRGQEPSSRWEARQH